MWQMRRPLASWFTRFPFHAVDNTRSPCSICGALGTSPLCHISGHRSVRDTIGCSLETGAQRPSVPRQPRRSCISPTLATVCSDIMHNICRVCRLPPSSKNSRRGGLRWCRSAAGPCVLALHVSVAAPLIPRIPHSRPHTLQASQRPADRVLLRAAANAALHSNTGPQRTDKTRCLPRTITTAVADDERPACPAWSLVSVSHISDQRVTA